MAEENTKATETTTEEGTSTAEENNSQQSETGTQTEKTFTQAEVNELIEKRLARERKKVEPKPTETKKTDDTATRLEALEKKLAHAEQEKAVLAKGVSNEFVDDVLTLAQTKVSDDTTIEKAIEDVLKKYPSLAGKKESGVTTGTKTTGSGEKISGVEAEFLKRNPDLKK